MMGAAMTYQLVGDSQSVPASFRGNNPNSRYIGEHGEDKTSSNCVSCHDHVAHDIPLAGHSRGDRSIGSVHLDQDQRLVF